MPPIVFLGHLLKLIVGAARDDRSPEERSAASRNEWRLLGRMLLGATVAFAAILLLTHLVR